MTYSEKINKLLYEGVEADEILPKIAEKLAPQVHTNIDAFIESLKKDDTFKPHGVLLHSFSINGNVIYFFYIFYDLYFYIYIKNYK